MRKHLQHQMKRNTRQTRTRILGQSRRRPRKAQRSLQMAPMTRSMTMDMAPVQAQKRRRDMALLRIKVIPPSWSLDPMTQPTREPRMKKDARSEMASTYCTTKTRRGMMRRETTVPKPRIELLMPGWTMGQELTTGCLTRATEPKMGHLGYTANWRWVLPPKKHTRNMTRARDFPS